MADTVIKHPQAMLQLRLSNFSVAYQGIPAVVNLSLTLTAATVNLVTGVIGAGKTTLLKALSGMIGHTGAPGASVPMARAPCSSPFRAASSPPT